MPSLPMRTASWWSGEKDAADVLAKAEKAPCRRGGQAQAARRRRARLDMYNMREPLKKAGLIYIDEPEED